MPSTLAGFLLLAGLLMFLFSLLGGIKYKDTGIESSSKAVRIIIGVMGVCFMLGSAMLYTAQIKDPIGFPDVKFNIKTK